MRGGDRVTRLQVHTQHMSMHASTVHVRALQCVCAAALDPIANHNLYMTNTPSQR